MRSNQGPDAPLQEHKAGSTKGENTCAHAILNCTINTSILLSRASGMGEQAPGMLIFSAQIFNHQELRQILALTCSRAGSQFSRRLCECLGCCQAGNQSRGRICECFCCRAGSSGRGFDSGAGSGSGGDGEAGTEEVGTPRAGARAPKGKRKRSNLGQAQVKACAAHFTSHIPRRTAHRPCEHLSVHCCLVQTYRGLPYSVGTQRSQQKAPCQGGPLH